MMTRWLCAAVVLSVGVTGCLDGTSPFDGYGPVVCSDPPCVPPTPPVPPGPPGPVVTKETLDDGSDLPAAVNGIYHLHILPTETAVVVNALDPALTAHVLPDAIEVVASRAGWGVIEVSNAIGTTQVQVEAAVATRVVIVPPRYQPLVETPVAYLGPDVAGAVRELAADGRPLADHSIVVTGDGVTATEDSFTLNGTAGVHALTVTAGALTSSALVDLTTVDAIDDLVVIETHSDDLHRVCGHAMHGDSELFARFTFTGVDAPVIAFANCLELPVIASDLTVTVSAGGLTRTLVAHAH